MKKFLILFFVILFSLVISTGAAAFSDVGTDHPHREAINLLNGLGIMEGITKSNFEPNAPITRAQAAKIFYTAVTTFEDGGNISSGFIDTAGHSLDGYISWCKNEGIVAGSGEYFYPDNNVTFDQMLKMASVTLGYGNFSSALWPTDVRLLAIKQLALTKGIEDTTGDRAITRAEAAQIIYNMLFCEANRYSSTVSYAKIFSKVGTIAYDMWGLEKYSASIVASKNYALDGYSLTSSDSSVYLSNAINLRTNKNDSEFEGSFTLGQLGLTAGNSDEVFGRNVEFYTQHGLTVKGSTELFGSTVMNPSLSTVKDENGADDITKISINGISHNVSDVWYELSSTGIAKKSGESYKPASLYDIAYGKFPLDANGNYRSAEEIPELFLIIYGDNRRYLSMTIDSDGDGIYDYLFVEGEMPYIVEKVSSNVTFKELLGTWRRNPNGVIVKSSAKKSTVAKTVIEGTYNVNQIVSAAKFGKLFYITETVLPIESYLTMVTNKSIRFNGDNTNYAVQNYSNSVFYQTSAANIDTSVLGASTTGKYYALNGNVFYADIPAPEPEAEKEIVVNYGVIISANGESEWILNEQTNTYYKEYPMTIYVDGRRVEIKVSSIDYTKELSDDRNNAYGQYLPDYTSDGKRILNYEFIAYVKNEDELYDVYTSETMRTLKLPEKTMLVSSGLTISRTNSTSTYKIGNYMCILNSKTKIYYVNDKGELAYYTKNTIPKDFIPANIVSCVQFNNSTSTVKTLGYMMLESDFEPEEVSMKTKTDSHLLFLGNGEELIYEDGNTCYYYRYISLKDCSFYEIASPLPAIAPDEEYNERLAIPMANGQLGAFMKDGKVLETITVGTDPSIYRDRAFEYHSRNKILFTQKNLEGLDVSNAKFIDITIENVGEKEEKYEIVSAEITSFDAFTARLEKAIEEDATVSVYVGYDINTKKINYILYSDKENDKIEGIIGG